MLSPNGTLYGTTQSGTVGGLSGTVFAVSPPVTPEGPWTKTTIYNFVGGYAGQLPIGGLIMGKGLVLYGTTSAGGTGIACGECGTVFRLTPSPAPGDPWTESVLYSFKGFNDGSQPWTAVTLDSAGALYGTTQYGGPANAGTVYQLTPPAAPAPGPSRCFTASKPRASRSRLIRIVWCWAATAPSTAQLSLMD